MIKLSIIRKLPNGKYRLYSRKKDSKGKRRNLGTYDTLADVRKREQQVQFFKGQHADDAVTQDHQTKALVDLSDIAQYLEAAGFVDKAQEVYDTMAALDEDLALDCLPDQQLNPDNINHMDEPGVGGSGMFGVPEAQRLAFIHSIAQVATDLDELGLTEDADELDAILRDFITKHEGQDNADQAAQVVGLSGGQTDSQSGQFSGLSDSYFYRSYESDEGRYNHEEVPQKLTI